MTDHEDALRAAREWWAEPRLLFLDTETTGLDNYAQVCELAIVGKDGAVLVNTLIKPTVPILGPALDVHGITDEMVKDAPGFDDVYEEQVLPLVLRPDNGLAVPAGPGPMILIYNASFDTRLMRQSRSPIHMGLLGPIDARASCVMELYAQYHGDWSDWHQSYKWQSLSAAAAQCGLAWPAGQHRALADAEMCRRVLEHMALGKIEGEE